MIIDKSYFNELASISPDDICNLEICAYNDTEKIYTIWLWGDEYSINPEEMTIYCKTSLKKPSHEYFSLFIIFYLLKISPFNTEKEWISEKDIPGGATFFRGPHEIPTDSISRQFGNDIKMFKDKCTKLGGEPLNMADAAYSFDITPSLPIAVLYWMGDEDFPAEAKILYDKAISDFFPLDIVFALAFEICTRIGS